MAKLALINRDYKRRQLVKKFDKKRAELKATISNQKASEEVRADARAKLQALPRNANPISFQPIDAGLPEKFRARISRGR